MPTRPCRGTPARKPTATATSLASSRPKSAARMATFSERELVSVRSCEAVTTSASRLIAGQVAKQPAPEDPGPRPPRGAAPVWHRHRGAEGDRYVFFFFKQKTAY